MNFELRKNCIFCENILNETYFDKDYSIPIACYSKEIISNDIFIPYNIFICNICKTVQTKYLGDLNEIYKYNHADGTGSIMTDLHLNIFNIIKEYKEFIKNIVEVGSSKGILSDLILDNDIVNKYYIIEPSFIGIKRENKIIINNFFENVNFNDYNDVNTIIISHVFEHFYEPKKILKVIEDNLKIEYFFLVWPDLEYYKDNNIYHVLNTEHTYYVDNNFIIELINNYSFELIERKNYKGHSVIFVFKRTNFKIKNKLININYNIDNYFNNLINSQNKIINFIKEDKINCIWPASVHTQFLLMFITNIKFDYILDNSPNKIDKYLYGYNIKILDFKKVSDDINYNIILNGGCFNSEINNNIHNKLYLNNSFDRVVNITMAFGLSLILIYFYMFQNNPNIFYNVCINKSTKDNLRINYDDKYLIEQLNFLSELCKYNNCNNVKIYYNYDCNFDDIYPMNIKMYNNKLILKKQIIPFKYINYKKYIVIGTKVCQIFYNNNDLKNIWDNSLKMNLTKLLKQYDIKIILTGEKKLYECKEYDIHRYFMIYEDLINNIIPDKIIDLTKDNTFSLYETNSIMDSFNILQQSLFNISIGFGGNAILYTLLNNHIILSKKWDTFDSFLNISNYNIINNSYWTEDINLFLEYVKNELDKTI